MSGEATLQMQVMEALAPGACLTTEQIAAATGLIRKYVSLAAAGLIRRSYLERKEVGCYQLTAEGVTAKLNGERLTCGPNGRNTAAKRPNRKTIRDKVWSALRIKGRASIPDLLQTVGAEPEKSASNVRRFLKALSAVGVVQRMARREAGATPTSNGNVRYLLVKDLGPKPPMVRKCGVLDPNSQTYLETEQ